MSPLDHYQALLKRITTWATEEECGKGKTPTTQAETDLILERLGHAMARAKIFHIDPERHKRQSYFLKANAPTVMAVSGNKFGKTFALLLKGMIASLGCCPWAPEDSELYNPLEPLHRFNEKTQEWQSFEPPVRIGLVVQDYGTALPQDIIPRLKEIIPWDALVVRESRVQGQIIDGFELFNGSIWKILSHKQDDEQYEGWSMHLILWNEPMPRSKFVGASRGSIEFDARHLMAFSPISEAWLYDQLYINSHIVNTQADFDEIAVKKPEIVTVEGTIWDNPYLTDKAIDRFKSRIHESEYGARLYGKFQHLAGLVFKQFSREKHVRELAALV